MLCIGSLAVVGCTGGNSPAPYDADDGPVTAMGDGFDAVQGGATTGEPAADVAAGAMDGGASTNMPAEDITADAVDFREAATGAMIARDASADVGDAVVESEAAVDAAADAVDGGVLRGGAATDEQLAAFRTALNRWAAIHAGIPDDVAAMVSSIELVLVGVLGPPGPGRKLYAGPGIFDSYANLQVREVEVLKGSLGDPSEHVHPEVPWPNNLPPDELVESAPVGARVIILGDHVPEALEEAQRLEEEGIPAVHTVKPNLVGLPPYGLLIESVDGETHAPLWELGSQGPLVKNGADTLATFEGALTAIRAVTGH